MGEPGRFAPCGQQMQPPPDPGHRLKTEAPQYAAASDKKVETKTETSISRATSAG